MLVAMKQGTMRSRLKNRMPCTVKEPWYQEGDSNPHTLAGGGF